MIRFTYRLKEPFLADAKSRIDDALNSLHPANTYPSTLPSINYAADIRITANDARSADAELLETLDYRWSNRKCPDEFTFPEHWERVSTTEYTRTKIDRSQS